MEAVLLLCDWAEEINGKLYIMGAGWSRVVASRMASIALGVLLFIPWDQANRPHNIEIRLLTEDGEPVETDGQRVVIPGKLEVRRPSGAHPGSRLEAPLALRFPALQLQPGSYRFELTVDGELSATASFQATGRLDGDGD